jgi:hypothetical protein
MDVDKSPKMVLGTKWKLHMSFGFVNIIPDGRAHQTQHLGVSVSTRLVLEGKLQTPF